MKHYVHLKFQSESYRAQLLDDTTEALEQALTQISGFQRYELLKAKGWTEKAPEVLLVLEFINSESLKTYLEHHLHKTLLQTVKPYLEEKSIFDGLI